MKPYYFLPLLFVLFLIFSCKENEDLTEILPKSQSAEDRFFVDSINQHFYTIYSADFQKAKKVTSQAVALCKHNQWDTALALSLKNQSIIQYMTGDYQGAISSSLEAYNIYEMLADTSGIARMSNEMGNFYRKVGDEKKAVEFWNQAEEYAKIAGDQEALGTAYGMKGTFYWLKRDFELSDSYYLKCYEIRKQENDSIGLGYILVDLADIEQRKRNLEGALTYFEQSTHIREKLNDKQGLIDNYKMLGDLFMNFSLPNRAIPYYQQCAAACTDLGYPDLQRKSYDSLSSAFAKLGDFKAAFDFDQQADLLRDSLFTAEKSQAISEIQVKYETEKKEQTIITQQAEIERQLAQNQRNTIAIVALFFIITLLIIVIALNKSRNKKQQTLLIKEAEAQLRNAQIEAAINSQEIERKRFARDLHDGFGQMISILNLNLQSLENGNNSREEVFENLTQILQEMYKELKSICFNLMPETLIKKGLVDALKEFILRINQSNKVIVTIDVFGFDNRLADLQEISIYRISQEWINNIIKYSNADKITLSLTKDNAEITLLIEDNGDGFDKSKLTNSTGNGWKNLNSRSNLIKGELELETQPGMKGSTLILNAPISIKVKATI